MKPLFITFEGGEGAGKSTMIERTGDWLSARNHDVVMTREPGGTPVAEQIRELVLGHGAEALAPTVELLLVFAARAQHLDRLIRPSLAAGKTVLCDRFTDATWAYQGGGRGLDAKLIAMLEAAVHGDLQPDLTILLDIPAQAGMDRVLGRGDRDRIESEHIGFFERVRAAYLERASQDVQRFAVIDASGDSAVVWRQVEQALQEHAGR